MNTSLMVLLTLMLALVAAVFATVAVWMMLGVRKRLAARSDHDSGLEQRLGQRLREEGQDTRREVGEQSRGQRSELSERLQQFGQQQQTQHSNLRETLAERLEAFTVEMREQTRRLADSQRQFLEDARKGRGEQAESLQRFGDVQRQALQQLTATQTQQADTLRAGLEKSLQTMRGENAEKLEQMRRTVDEKLHETLERRLGESFKLVSDRLEMVHKGLGEMQELATGVGDLKRVLTNVKSRGIFGEVQLAALLEQVLTPEQYDANVATRPGSNERVEFAIKLPGRSDDGTAVWLPIDAKFPREDYERLIDAQERADGPAAEAAAAALERRIRDEAKAIAEKYLAPPHTTDFGIMFLPTEGLYAEVLRRPGLHEALQRDHRITVAGPSNLLAFLNSLRMGFRTLAIEKRSSEVWQVLGAVKTEFGKFGDVLDKVKKKLDEASTQIDQTGVRTRAISRHLRGVEEAPAALTDKLLSPSPDDN